MSFLAVKGFYANLVQVLPPYHVIISTCMSVVLCARFLMCTSVHLKQFWGHKKLEYMKA